MSDETTGIIHACSIAGDQTGAPLQGDAIAKMIQDDALAWVHLDANNPASRTWLHTHVIHHLDHIIFDALLEDETRPRIIEFDSGALVILRGVNLNEGADPEDMISIRLWIDENRIISVQRRPLKAVRDLYDSLIAGTGPKNAGDFLAHLTARLCMRMEPIFLDLNDALDDIEETVMENPKTEERQDITNIRKQSIIYRRYMLPQRDVVMHLRNSDFTWIDLTHKRSLQETLDRLIRYLEDLDAVRERAQIIKDELNTALSDGMNRNLYMLSIISAIFLPLGFLTGLLGINVGGIPGADDGSAFWIFCAMLTGIIAVQMLLFKKMKWF